MALPELLTDRAAYRSRLEAILPAAVTGTTASCNDIASAAAFVLIYVGAVGTRRKVRPSMVTNMDSHMAMLRSNEERMAWHRAAERGTRAIDELAASWGVNSRRPWYADNSRESVRDETFRSWASNGALLVDESVPATSSKGRYSLTEAFAALLDPSAESQPLEAAIMSWQAANLSTAGRLRARRLRESGRRTNAIQVSLPDGGTRSLLVGPSSEILKGVIEEFTRFLAEPTVVFISQSGEKVSVIDQGLLDELGLSPDQERLLPDALIADLAPGRDEFWFVEAVATDGPVHEDRKAQFLGWAMMHGLDPARCRFLTAFESRTSSQAKKALPMLARGTFAWFNDEPDALLSWTDLIPGPVGG